MSQKKKVVLAVLASLLFHLLLIAFFIWWRTAHPLAMSAVAEPPQPMQITLVPQEDLPVAPVPAATPERQIISADNMIDASTPPPDAAFDSDRDTLGASEKSGTGPKDLPSVEGRESESLELRNQQAILGKEGEASHQPPQTLPEETPAPQPTPVAQQTPPPSTPPPDATPAPTPPSQEDLILALNRAQPFMTPQVQPKPTPRAGGTYQPQTQASQMEGSLSNRGRPSLATRGTPLGRYINQVRIAVGSRWYYYIERDREFLSPGAVRIVFCINQDGKIENLRRLSNTANESLASVSEQSIFDAELPPIPADIVPTLATGRLELPFNFTIYPNN